MRIQFSLLLITVLHMFQFLVGAAEPADEPPSRTVGSVLGKNVTAADIGLPEPIDPEVVFDARDTVRWNLMGRITAAFGGPVVDRFVKKQKIKATAEEIDKFKRTTRKQTERNVRDWEAQLVELKKKLAAPDLSASDKAKLEGEQATLTKLLAGGRRSDEGDASEDVARMLIVAWKTERELHRVYGGRVIFQQFGPEALDARRRLFEQAEKEGDLKFTDAGVRHMFYYYSQMRHVVVDEKALAEPWFLKDDE